MDSDEFRLLDAAPDAMIVVDRDGTILFANERAGQLFGYGPRELVSQNVDVLVPESLRGTHEHRRGDYQKAPRARAMGGPELAAVRKDGAEFPVEISLSPLERAHGRVAIAAIRDVTERKKSQDELRRAEEQLQQSQKMEAIGRLAGGVAHDFNNLLSVILSYTSLAEEVASSQELREDLDEIRHASERASDLVRQLLAFGRKQVLQPRPTDLGELLRGMEKMLRRLVSEDVEVTLIGHGALGVVQIDPTQIEQVVMNLVANARDAMPKGGQLTIETSNVALDESYAAEHPGVKPGRYVLLAVTDTGVGMDDATRAHVFEPFFTTKEKERGTGLGLATVFGIVQQSGGHIWVYSEPGRGSTFKLYFPCIAEPAVSTLAPPAMQVRGGRETILLVEDHDAVRKLVTMVLRRAGYNVLEAQNGGEALIVCERYGAAIHLLLTDVIMPRMSGPELARRLAPLRSSMKVLFMSGYTENAIVHHGVLEGGVEFLPKPITPPALLTKVREVLDR